MSAEKLVNSTQLDSDLTSVANAIRTKGGTSESLAFPAGFISAVQAIPSGGGGSGEILLASGVYTNVGGSEMTIPVSYNGVGTKVFVIGRDPVVGATQVNAWVNSNITTPSEIINAIGGNTTFTRQMAANGNITYPGTHNCALTEDSIICGKNTGAYNIASLTYDWYIWGYTV